MTVECPSFRTWEEAFKFANAEIWASFEALSHGDLDAARALNESAQAANSIANELLSK